MAKTSLIELQTQGIRLPELITLPQPRYVRLPTRMTWGHPFIEAVGQQVLDAPNFLLGIADKLPLAPADGLTPGTNSILAALECVSLFGAPYPVTNLARLYERLLQVITCGHVFRNPFNQKEMAEIYYRLKVDEPMALLEFVDSHTEVSPCSLLVMGTSGMGKTFCVKTALSQLGPQAFRHVSYEGQPFNQVQVVWLLVTCPPNGSLHSLLLEILLALDLVLGTRFYFTWLNSRATVPVLMINVTLILMSHGVGALVLDELQHLKVRGYSETELNLNYFVALMNFLNIPLVSIGTYAARAVIDGNLRDTRRICGAGTIDFARYEVSAAETRAVQQHYLSFWPGQQHRPITPELHQKVYDLYQGLHFLLPNMTQRVTAEVAYRKLTYVTDDVLEYYGRVELAPLSGALQALRSGSPNAIARWDDLLSREALEELRKHQAGLDHSKNSTTWFSPETKPAEARKPGEPFTFDLPEFPSAHIGQDQIALEAKRTRMLFGTGDIYPSLKRAGLIASGMARGRYLPEQNAS